MTTEILRSVDVNKGLGQSYHRALTCITKNTHEKHGTVSSLTSGTSELIPYTAERTLQIHALPRVSILQEATKTPPLSFLKAHKVMVRDIPQHEWHRAWKLRASRNYCGEGFMSS
jgi:hypothetical protein